MARLTQIGFELNTITAGVEFDTTNSPTISSTTFRSGVYAMKVTPLVSGSSIGFRTQFSGSNTTGPIFARCYFYFVTLPSAANAIFRIANAALGVIAKIKIDNTGALTLFDEDGSIGSASSALSLNAWHYIEIKIDATAAAGSHIVEGKLDGSVFATASNRNLSTGVALIRGIGSNWDGEAQTTGEWYIDDFAVNDGSGSFQNSYPGASQIIHMLPDSAGDSASWTHAGSSDTGVNYSNVNEVTPDNAVTIVTSKTANQEDLHNLAASPSSIGASDTINVVALNVRFNGGAASSNSSFKLEIESSSGGTIEQSAAITPIVTAYRTNVANIATYNPPLVLYDLPGASTTAWTKSDLDTTQVGYKLTTASTNIAGITAIWLSVDSTPAGAPTSNPHVIHPLYYSGLH